MKDVSIHDQQIFTAVKNLEKNDHLNEKFIFFKEQK